MKEVIFNILKGMVIGVANIIPGVSGGTMMVSMGIYDKLIFLLTHIIKRFKEAVRFLAPIAVGMVLAIALLSKVITYMFDNIPLQTTLLFIGLIVGGLPAIWTKVKGKTINAPSIIAFLVFFSVVVGLSLIGESENAADVSLSFINVIKLFFAGVIAAATMVIPGVSGSMIMMLMGYYTVIIGSISALLSALHPFDINAILLNCGVLVPFGCGVVVGIVVVAKLIEFVLKRHEQIAYWGIIGLIVASPIAILIMMEGAVINVVNVLTGIVMLAAGFGIAMKLGGE